MDDSTQPLRELLARPSPREERGRQAAEWIRTRGGYRWVGIYDVTLDAIAAFAWTGDRAPAFPRFPRTQGLCGAAVASGQPVIVEDVSNDPRYLTTFDSTGAEAIFPVWNQGSEIVRTLDVESDRVGAFTTSDRVFLEECALPISPLWSDR